MNNNQLFDEHIKEQVGGYSPQVHPRIWEKIIAEKEKRKPAGFWFTLLHKRNLLIIAVLLFAGGAGIYLFFSNYSTGIKNTEIAATGKNDIETNNNKNITGNNPDHKDETGVSNINTTGFSPGLNNTVSPFSDPADKENYSASGIRTENTKSNSLINIIPGLLSTADNPNMDLTYDEPPVGGTTLNRLLYFGQKIAAGKKINSNLMLLKPPFALLPDCPALEKNASGNKKYFEFYGGPDYAFQSLKDTGNSAYLQKRKESTSFTSAYSAGIRYTRVFKNSMSIRGGVNYSQINEKFTFKQGNLVQITYIIDANGDTTGSYITTGTRFKTTHNKYRSIDVPLTLGYELGNERLHANINAGAIVNIYSWANGEVLDTAFRPVSITTGKGASPYSIKTNAGVGFIAAVSVYYKLNDKMHIMVEPYYRHNFSQLNKENLTIKQKYNTAGIRVGLRLDLR